MIPLSLSYIAQTLGWRLIGEDQTLSSLSTDSRQVDKGDCFIALYGDNFDAHAFIEQVIVAGATSLIVSQAQEDCSVPQLVVEDTRLALAQLAALNKSLADVKTIAITGSCGKTTVKEMISAILSLKGEVLATLGNFNNEIGAPLTLLRLAREHQYAVIELGANHIGEIDFTSGLTKPDVSVITNIGAAHLEGFGSIDGVVTAKSEIYNHLAINGTAIFDADIQYADKWRAQNSDKCIACFSDQSVLNNQDDVWATEINVLANGCAEFVLNTQTDHQQITLSVPGLHNVKNALAAAAATIAVGASLNDIVIGLASMANVKGRLNVNVISPQLSVIDDTYNANANSIKAAIEVLANTQGRKILVLGEMGELGDYAVECHQSLGPVIEENNIDCLMTIGELSKHYGHHYSGQHQHFDNKAALYQALEQDIVSQENQCINVLVKGSRSATMETVVEFIKNNKNIGVPAQC
ncbi:MAG: UDP-N-acetylmuramoyl-tripeptide--D-alanyl-D-alanine ligase [Psychrobium sp.]